MFEILIDVLTDFVHSCTCMKFRLVAASDFAKQMTWPELVPAFKTAIQNSDLMNGTGASELKTMNVLIGLQTIIKPFQVLSPSFERLE